MYLKRQKMPQKVFYYYKNLINIINIFKKNIYINYPSAGTPSHPLLLIHFGGPSPTILFLWIKCHFFRDPSLNLTFSTILFYPLLIWTIFLKFIWKKKKHLYFYPLLPILILFDHCMLFYTNFDYYGNLWHFMSILVNTKSLKIKSFFCLRSDIHGCRSKRQL